MLWLDPWPDNSSPKWPKTYPTYDVTHKKNKTQNQTLFFYCEPEDSPSLLRVWTALQHNLLPSYGVAKTWPIITFSKQNSTGSKGI